MGLGFAVNAFGVVPLGQMQETRKLECRLAEQRRWPSEREVRVWTARERGKLFTESKVDHE